LSPELADAVTLLTGWGGTPSSAAHLRHAITRAVVEDALSQPGPRPIIARGLGRSYGDAAQAAGGLVLDTTALRQPLELDRERGVVRVGAGVSLQELTRAVLPHGWFLPVTPGTTHVTIAGAIAANVHGKNHHRDGAFGRWVRRFVLATPSGVVEVEPGSDLFRATVGGMGLTGVILEAEIQLIPVETRFVLDREIATRSLEETLEALRHDTEVRYAVAWLDATASGTRLGRGLVSLADHAPRAALPERTASDPLTLPRERTLAAPPFAPTGLLSRPTIRTFNTAWYELGKRRPERALVDLRSYFYPLDRVRRWNRLYGPRGFLQYQVVVPDDATNAIRTILEALVHHGHPSFLSVLKRFGPGDDGFLSFPMAGWTLALDLPARRPGLESLLERLDNLVSDVGGRIYLAKDSRLRPRTFEHMYPELARFQAVREAVGARGVIASDLSRRLHLD